MYSESFRHKLKGLRKSHGFTQDEVANEVEINRVNLSHYENGKREPDIRTIAILAEFYGVSTDFLIGNGLHAFHGFEPVSNWDGIKLHGEDFPARMKFARKLKGQSQLAVAKSLGIPQSTLAKYELGQLQPSIETLAKITLYYRIQADWLLGLTEEMDINKRINIG